MVFSHAKGLRVGNILNYLTLQELKNVLIQFEECLKKYSYIVYRINEKEKVFIIEDSLVLYVGFLTYKEDLLEPKCNCAYKVDLKNYEDEYRLRIEELTYNSINFNCKSFIQKNLKIKNKLIFYRYLPYFRCDRNKFKEQINNFIPEIQLDKRNKSWVGILYYIIIFEVVALDKKLGLGVFYTTQKPQSYVNARCKKWIKESFEAGNMNMIGQGPCKIFGVYTYHLENAFKTYKHTKFSRENILEKYFQYFYIKKYFKDKDDVHKYAVLICNQACQGSFQNIERSKYLKPTNKWVSEELVYKLTKQIFKDYHVIYQHRPFFLRSDNGGQMSYDIFIAGMNIAIEYQGKQHFEPVEFFGGETGFERTIKRDKIKKELSKKNNIKLIYINYWENINKNLIYNKINEIREEE
nr:MAG TPA: restriction enzyme [Caudoviricetes sp.]